MIQVFVTGGTFDKEYNYLTGELYFKDTHLSAKGVTVYNVFSKAHSQFEYAMKAWGEATGYTDAFECHSKYLITANLLNQGVMSSGMVTFKDPAAEMLFKLSAQPIKL